MKTAGRNPSDRGGAPCLADIRICAGDEKASHEVRPALLVVADRNLESSQHRGELFLFGINKEDIVEHDGSRLMPGVQNQSAGPEKHVLKTSLISLSMRRFGAE